MLDPDELAQIAQEVAECKAIIETGALGDVEAAVEQLEQSAQRIGEAIYATAESATDGEGGG